MNNERKEEIRQEDRKYSKQFRLAMVLSIIAGIILGGGAVILWDRVMSLYDWLAFTALPYVGLAMLWVSLIVSAVLSIPLYRKGREMMLAAGEEDDELREAGDAKLGKALSITSVAIVPVFTGYALAVGRMQSDFWSDSLIAVILYLVLTLAGLIMGLAFLFVFQKRIVNFLKEQNPEKRGSVNQVDFQKVWVDSCDEAEKAVIYRSGYAAYRAGHYACLICWMFATIGNMMGWANFVTVLFIGVIWLALQLSYMITAQKQSGGSAVR